MTLAPLSPSLYMYSDVCNVYVVKRGTAGLLIDFGTGAVLDHLDDIGVTDIDWVLHTHHHRDQCQGDELLEGTRTQIAVPAMEATFFEGAESFWQDLQLSDRYDCTNVFNTLARSVQIHRRIMDNDELVWNDLTFRAYPTPGHTKGSLTYLAQIDGLLIGFSGDLIFGPGRVWSLYDLQWDYSNPDALNAALHSVRLLQQQAPDRLAPSHGSVVMNPASALETLETNLRRLYRVAGRRYLGDIQVPMAGDTSFEQVSEHLIAVTHTSANFYALTSDDGSALLFDYGFGSFDHVAAGCRFVEHSLNELRDTYGVNQIERLITTHYHDDHVAGAELLTQRFGAEIWAFRNYADILSNPRAYRLPAIWRTPIRVTHVFDEGETIEWRDYRFVATHNPGHTWYSTMLFGEIDGRRVAVTGDQIQLSLDGTLRGGGPVYRNRVYADSFTSSLKKIIAYRPDMLLTGHDGALEVTRADLAAVYEWCKELEASLRALSAFPKEVNYSLDPAFVSVYPYEAVAAPGAPVTLGVEVRNHCDRVEDCRLSVAVPRGWNVEPRTLAVRLDMDESVRSSVVVVPATDAKLHARYVITVSAEIGGHRFGEVAESILMIQRKMN